MARISKATVELVKNHARELAEKASHQANGGAALECLDTGHDLDRNGKPNASGKAKLAIWKEEFFKHVTQAQYDSHQPG